MLHLTKPLVTLDVETTGLDVQNDRIIQIALLKVTDLSVYPSVVSERYVTNVNPLRPIPPASTAIHGLTDADVCNAPTFATIAQDILTFLEGCDLSGFNSNSCDVPLLAAEFARIGIDFKPGYLIDAGNLFKIQEPRNLSAAVTFYCHREHSAAHDAEADALATLNVLRAQLERYPELPGTVEALARYCNYGKRQADLSGKFVYDEADVLCFNFGPHKGKPAIEHVDYCEWICNKDFARDTRAIAETVIRQYYAQYENDANDDDNEPF